MNLRSKLAFFIALNNYVEMIVNGVAPLSLPRAKAKPITKLTAFGGTEQRNLPAEYTQLEYIESTGTQYIDTEITNENCNTYGVKTKYYYTAVTASSSLCGNYESNTGKASFGQFFVSATHTGDAIFTGIGNVSTCARPNVPEQTDLTDEFTINCTAGTISRNFNGESLSGSGLDFSIRSSRPCLLFACNSSSGAIQYTKARISYFQILKDNVLVFNGIPAKNSSNVIGMYDTVSGQFFTNAGTGTFAAGGEAVPTPDTPMDIVSNNGVLKARHASGLPLGYTLLDYIESSGTQYIDTGYKPNTNTTIKTKTYVAERSNAPFACRWTGSPEYDTYGFIIGSNGDGRFYYGRFSDQEFTGNLSFTTGIVYDIEINETTAVLGADVYNISRTAFTSTYSLTLGAFNNQDTILNQLVGRLYAFEIKESGVLVHNFIPCKNASSVVGMYDTVSGQFFTNAGTGDFVAGDPVSDPVGIYADGVVETINVHGKNLFDANSDWDFNTSMNYSAPEMSFPAVSSGGNRHVFFFKCQPNTTYTISASTYGDRLWVGGLNNIVDPASYTSDNPVVFDTIFARLSSASAPVTFTTGADTKLVGVYYSLNTLPTNLQIEQGSTATTYEPYYDGGTATAEMLLSLGDYTDEQEIISGVVTRKLGVAVLDGTETWTKNSAGIFSCQDIIDSISKQDGYCTHFKKVADATSFGDMNVGTYKLHSSSGKSLYFNYDTSATVSDWTTYLANQYAAGTPVIIVYPLATETTDTVTGQPMNTTAGDNILEITQASLDGLELECRYFKGK